MWFLCIHPMGQIHLLLIVNVAHDCSPNPNCFFLEHNICSNLLPIAVIKDHDKKQAGEERVDLVHSSQTQPIEKVRAGGTQVEV